MILRPVIGLLVVVAAIPAGAREWTGGAGGYFSGENWTPTGVPDGRTPAVIASGTASASGVDTFFERGADTWITGGSLVLEQFRFLNGRGGPAAFHVKAGSLLHDGTYFIVGQNDRGLFRQEGGTVATTVSRGFFLSDGSGGSSSLELRGGSFTVEMNGSYNSDLHNAWLGRGGAMDRLVVDGGDFSLANTAAGSSQRWFMMTRNASLVVESGRVAMTNLQAVTVGQARSGVAATDTATMVVRGGTVGAQVRVAFVVGWGTNGALGIHGGETTISRVGTSGGDLWIDGQAATTWATVGQSAGTLTVEGEIIIARHATGSVASFTMDGGLLRAGALSRGAGAHGRFHFNGGTVVLAGDRRTLADESWFVAAGPVAADYDAVADETTLTVDATSHPEAGFHLTFDGGFADAGPAGNDGSPAGGAVIDDDALGVVAGGGALRLDGAAATRVSLARPVSFGATEPWTVAWWGRRTHLGGSKGMVVGQAGTNGNFIWLNDSSRGLRFRPENALSHDFFAPRDSALRHHALVADGAGRLDLYLDGVHSETLAGLTAWTLDSIGQGFPTGGSNFNYQGWLDELRVIPEALDATAVSALHAADAPVRTPPKPGRVRVFLLGGQSNAESHGPANLLDPDLFYPQDDVDFFYHFPNGPFVLATVRPGVSRGGSFGPEIPMARWLAGHYAEREPDTRVAIIKYARGGTNLHTQWRPGDGAEYLVFKQTVAAGIAALAGAYPEADITLDGMAWMQGEADCTNEHAPVYQGNLAAFAADVRANFGADMPFVIGRLSVNQTNRQPGPLATVMAAQSAVAAADPRSSLVDTDGFGLLGDNLHFDTQGNLDMGAAFARELAYLSWMNAALIDASLGAPDADPNGNGMPNDLEWRFGFDPAAPHPGLQASIRGNTDGGYLFTINRVISEGEFLLQEAPSPGEPWAPSTVQPVVTGRADGFSLTIPPFSEPHRFYRIRYQP